MVTVVGFARRMNHMVLVQAGVLSETLVTARNSADVRLLTWRWWDTLLSLWSEIIPYFYTNKSMQTQSVFRFHNNDTFICWKQLRADKTSTCVDPHVIFVIGGTCKSSSTAGFGAVVRPLTSVSTDVDFTNVGSGERSPTAFKWTFKRFFSYKMKCYAI